MTKRLTEKQKEEILKSFKLGTAINVLSQKYTCTNSTIIRNLKKILGELKFKELFNKSKSLKGKPKINENKNIDLQKNNFDNEESKEDINIHQVEKENISASNFDNDHVLYAQSQYNLVGV